MTNERMFRKAIEEGNLEVIKKLIGERVIDPNQFPLDQHRSAIDIAVLHGHVDVVDYLFTQSSKATLANRKSFLYSICCADSLKRPALLEWLKNRYQLLAEFIGTSHLNAVLGESFDATDKTLHGGLSVMHYAALVANKNLVFSDCLALLNQPIETGYFQGVTLARLLVRNEQWRLLKDLAEKTTIPIDLNVVPTHEGHPGRNTSVAWMLAIKGQWDLFKDIAAKTTVSIDLNTAPTHEGNPSRNTSLAWKLAYNEQWDLLRDLAARTTIPVDLNAAPIHEGHLGRNTSVAWILAAKAQWDLLRDLAVKAAIPVDLNVAPPHEECTHRNISVAWILAVNGHWDLLKDLAAKAAIPIDLNVAPAHEGHSHRNMSLAWILAVNGHWDLLKDWAAKTTIPIDLNAAFTHEGYTHRNISLAWLLADHKQWDLFKDLAAKTVISIDLNAAPTHEEHVHRNISLAWLLASNGQWALFKDLVAQTTRPINLSVGLIGQNGDMNTLNELLIANKQWDLLDKIIKTHIYDQGVNQVFEKLHMYEHQINELLSGDEIAIEAIVDVVTHFFTALNQITPQTGDSCYQEAQAIKGHVILMFLDKGSQICTLICEQFPDQVNKKDFTVVNDTNTLLAEAISDFTSGADSGLVRLLTKDHLDKKEILQIRNNELQCKYDELQRRCEALEQQLNIQQHNQQTFDEGMTCAQKKSSSQCLNRMSFSESGREQFFQRESTPASGSKKRSASIDEDSLYEESHENSEPSLKYIKMTGLT